MTRRPELNPVAHSKPAIKKLWNFMDFALGDQSGQYVQLRLSGSCVQGTFRPLIIVPVAPTPDPTSQAAGDTAQMADPSRERPKQQARRAATRCNQSSGHPLR